MLPSREASFFIGVSHVDSRAAHLYSFSLKQAVLYLFLRVLYLVILRVLYLVILRALYLVFFRALMKRSMASRVTCCITTTCESFPPKRGSSLLARL